MRYVSSSNPKKNHYVEWEAFEDGCYKIAEWARPQKFKNLYTIPRGGLAIALRLSHLLGIPIVSEPQQGTLVVDDIADDGDTLEPYEGFSIATLFYHRRSSVVPDKWVFEKKEKHIVFPWERGGVEDNARQ